MFIYKWLFVLGCVFFFSCGEILHSIAEESANEVNQENNEVYEADDLVNKETFNVIDRKITGKDTLSLVQGYFLNGKKYYESWQQYSLPRGVTTFFYPSGKVSYTVLYKNGREFTLLSCFDKRGNPIDGGTLKDGTGTLIIYHPLTGKTMYKAEYKNGLRNGKYIGYFSDGKPGQEMTFLNDTMVGSYVKYYRSGKVYSKRNVDMRTETGVIDNYYANGNKQSHEEYRNGEQSTYTEYDVSGTVTEERKTINHELIGTKYFYGPEGKLISKERSLNGKRHGRHEFFYDNGKRKSLEIFRNDTVLSETIWFENGKISAESVYKNGRKTGVYKEYYATGNIRVEQTYVDGVEEGPYKSYFDSGKIYNDGQFKDGELTGDLKFYSKSGQLTRTKKYD
jgi:uncharacterized protein